MAPTDKPAKVDGSSGKFWTGRQRRSAQGRNSWAGSGKAEKGKQWDDQLPPWWGALDSQNLPWFDAWGGSGVYKPDNKASGGYVGPKAGNKARGGKAFKGSGKAGAAAWPSMAEEGPKTLVQESLEVAAKSPPLKPNEAPVGPAALLSPESMLGDWADSLGNKVMVVSTDAYQCRLLATLVKPPRNDIYLQVAPILMDGAVVGWQCGNSILDPFWSSREELHWFARNGNVSVWVRTSRSRSQSLMESSPKSDADKKKEEEAASDRAANCFAADRAAEDKKDEASR